LVEHVEHVEQKGADRGRRAPSGLAAGGQAACAAPDCGEVVAAVRLVTSDPFVAAPGLRPRAVTKRPPAVRRSRLLPLLACAPARAARIRSRLRRELQDKGKTATAVGGGCVGAAPAAEVAVGGAVAGPVKRLSFL
jgi:hypothetical protein